MVDSEERGFFDNRMYTVHLHMRWQLIYITAAVFKDDIPSVELQWLVRVDGHHHAAYVGLKTNIASW